MKDPVTCQNCKFIELGMKYYKQPVFRCTNRATTQFEGWDPITGDPKNSYPLCVEKNSGLDCEGFEPDVVYTWWRWLIKLIFGSSDYE